VGTVRAAAKMTTSKNRRKRGIKMMAEVAVIVKAILLTVKVRLLIASTRNQPLMIVSQ
jgi:hypothetical protein